MIVSYVQGVPWKELLMAPFGEPFYFGKVLVINFPSTWNNLLKHCIPPEFLQMEGYVHGALRKELLIAPFVELSKTITLEESW